MRRLINVLFIFILFFLRLQFLPKLNLKDGQIVRVTGRIGEEPQVSGSVQKFKVGEFEIVTERYPEFEYGNMVVVEGSIKVENCHPDRTAVSGGIPFFGGRIHERKRFLDYAKSDLASLGMTIFDKCPYALSFPKISLARPRLAAGSRLAKLKNWDIKGLAIKLRQNLRQVYKKIFVTPYDGIVAGIVLGDKTLLPLYFYENLKKTGTLHILVASGTNISIMVLGILDFLCYFFKRKKAVLLLIVLIWFYSLMTGLQPPIIRAAVMSSMVFLAELLGRKVEAGNVLWLTGLLMIFINPYLIKDVGFQLSFMATAGLVYIQPVLKEKINKSEIRISNIETLLRPNGLRKGTANPNDQNPNDKNKTVLNLKNSNLAYFVSDFGFRASNLLKSDNFTSSLSAQIATLPILFIAFGQFNLLSPIINLLILWTIPLILQIGGAIGIVGLFGTIGLDTAKIASYPFIPLLFYLEQIINQTAKITLFQIQVGKISWLVWVVYYLALVIWIKIRNPKHEIRNKFK